jgi:amino acid transporter
MERKDDTVEKTDSSEVNVLETDSTDDMTDRVAKAVVHRKLGARQIQLTSIAGSIGAALFVAIGSGLPGGPLALLVGFIFWASVIFAIAQCQLEIVSLLPLDGSYIRLAARIVDPALGVAAGYNMFVSA